MIEHEHIESYMDVCRELELDDNERRELWVEIARQLERVEARLGGSTSVTDEHIAAVLKELDVPTFRVMGERIKAQRPAAAYVIGDFPRAYGVNHEDRIRVAEFASEIFG